MCYVLQTWSQARQPDDPTTAREELELDLMEEDASEVGEIIGDPVD